MNNKYRCNNCGIIFSEMDFIVTTEQVARSDGDWISERVFHCPKCESEDFEEIKEERERCKMKGEWKETYDGRIGFGGLIIPVFVGYRCSICGKVSQEADKFCPKCGKEMKEYEGEKNDDEDDD